MGIFDSPKSHYDPLDYEEPYSTKIKCLAPALGMTGFTPTQ